MNNRRAFEIAFVGLKPGVHNFEYDINDKFFADYGEQDFTDCTAKIKLELDRKSSFMLLKFDVDGNVNVVCDRCGNTLSKNLWDEFNIVVKMVDEPQQMNEQEEDPDVYYIARTESHLFVGDWIYEFINLSIPMQKNCGDDAIGGPQCNNEVLEKLRQMENNINHSTNPLWKDLDRFKGLEN